MKPEKIEYGGWRNCLRLSNETIELVVTLDVGPRVIRFGFVDGQNLFKNFNAQLGRTDAEEWLSFGGHRLWHAPEVFPRTYHPDNDPVAEQWDGKVLKLVQPVEKHNGIEKSIDIRLDEHRDQVELIHRICNRNPWGVELAPWCLSVMAAGGRAVVPQEKYLPHPDCLVPARPLVLWHFTKMNDPRWIWGEKYFQLRQDDTVPSKQKVGAMNTKGWVAYVLNGEVFIKRFAFEPTATYPDFGCNCEFYTEPGFLEIESLGPMRRVAPDETVEHVERWALHEAQIDEDEDSIENKLLPLVEQTSVPNHNGHTGHGKRGDYRCHPKEETIREAVSLSSPGPRRKSTLSW